MSASGGTAKKRRRIPIEHYDRVSTMLISMVPYSMIARQLSGEWKKTKKYIMEVIQTIHEDWADQSALATPGRKHQIRQAFEHLFITAKTAKDTGNATRILRELALLDGSYAKTQVAIEHSGSMGVGINLGALGFKTPDEVQARIEEIRERLAAQGPKFLQSVSPNVSILLSDEQAGTLIPSNGANGHDLAQEIIDVPLDPEPEGGEGETS